MIATFTVQPEQPFKIYQSFNISYLMEIKLENNQFNIEACTIHCKSGIPGFYLILAARFVILDHSFGFLSPVLYLVYHIVTRISAYREQCKLSLI